MFALVDANNMYVSCERVFQPRLCGRPVVVLSSNDGACIARSNEAKELGVKMAQPWFQVRHLERSAGLLAVSANFELYGDMSSRMMGVVARFAPRQEVYSIDESFLDFDGVRGDLGGIGRDLRATVLMETGLPTSVGFGPTKTLAKLANHIAKTADRKPGSYPGHLAQVCNLDALSESDRLQAFAATEVGNVWGVGRKIGARLVEGGVRTVLDLVRCDVATLRKQFSVVLEKTVLELRGTSCLSMDDAPAAKQQILVSRSFGKAVTDVAGIVEAVSEFASRAAESLRLQDRRRRGRQRVLHDQPVPPERSAAQSQCDGTAGSAHLGFPASGRRGRRRRAPPVSSWLQLRQGRRHVGGPAARKSETGRARPLLRCPRPACVAAPARPLGADGHHG